jgi:prephenate dehydrogenase
MCIIGFGKMGKRAAHIFSRRFTVSIVSSRDIIEEAATSSATQTDNPDEEIARSDFIFLAVPVNVLGSWVPRINRFSQQNCVVMDCCSARTAAEKELSKLQRARFGLPEFSPGATPAIGTPDERIAEFLKAQGCILRPETAQEYDQHHITEGIVQFLGIVLDSYLDEAQRTRLKKSGAGLSFHKLIENMKSNSSTTYRETQMMNSFMADARNKLIAEFQKIDNELKEGTFSFKTRSVEKSNE